IGFDRRRALIAIDGRVLVRELTLPDVALGLLVRERLVAPNGVLPHEAAAGRELPFGFRGQALPSPTGRRQGAVPKDLVEGVVVLARDAAARPFGMTPARAGSPLPPLREVPQILDGAGRKRENQRARDELLLGGRGRSRRHLLQDLVRVRRLFSRGRIAG